MIATPAEMLVVAARYYYGFNRMLHDLYETLDTDKKHPYLAEFENGLMTQKVIDAVRQSAKEGKRISVK